MSTVRLRRLQADFQNVQDYVNRHPRVQLIQTDGTPPERYQLQYQIKSLRQKDERLVAAETHLVEISLPRNYPRVPPQCRMLTPIFHPNIAPHAICIGDHWSAGESLASIIARIGELIAYQSYNTKSPLNGEAARWTSENLDRLPLDPVSMVAEEARRPAPPALPSSPPPAAPGASAPVAIPVDVLKVRCSGCNAVLHVPTHLRGKKFRCPRCRAVSTVPAGEAADER
jgi:ubiquitin-protein ligase